MRSIQLLENRAALGPLVTAGFAACVAIAATETWSLRFAHAAAGTEDNRGITVLAAGLAIVAVSFASVFGLLDKRTYAATSSALAVLVLAMALWFWATPVGNLDPALGEPSRVNYTIPGMRVYGSTGLFMAIVAGSTLAAALAWQWRSIRRGTDDETPLQPQIAAAFALFTVLGVLSPWVEGFRWSELGVESTAGKVALVAAGDGLILCALRAFGHVGDSVFTRLATVVGAALFVAPLWTLKMTVGDGDPAFENMNILCICPGIGAASGLYLTLAAGFGFVATTLLPVIWQDPRLLRVRHSVWLRIERVRLNA